MITLTELKSSLVQVLNGTITASSFASLAQQLNCEISSHLDVGKQRRLLQKQILVHIIREDPSEYYQKLLHETESWLRLKKEAGFLCCFAGCPWVGRRHIRYVCHLKKTHFLQSKFRCNYGKSCKQMFTSIEQLESHVADIHSKKPESRARDGHIQSTLPIVGSCKCPLQSCGQRQFSSLKSLMTHFNSKDHSLERRICIFQSCEKVISPQEIGRKHFYYHHKLTNKLSLKQECFIVNPTETDSIDDGTQVELSSVHGDDALSDGDDIDDEDEDEMLTTDAGDLDDDEDEQLRFTKDFANFLNGLSNLQMVPHTTIDIIMEEFLRISLKSQEIRSIKLLAKLRTLNVSEDIIAEVIKINQNDEMIEAQRCLKTRFKREQFMKRNFNFIQPKEIILNPQSVKAGAAKECYHYIPIIDSFKCLVEDPTYLGVLEKQRQDVTIKEDLIQNFTDGSLIKNLEYFQANPEASPLGIYSDALEVSNPLGSSKGKHKIINLFWVPLNVPIRYRSKVDNIFLAIVVKEKYVRKYGYKKIYRPLINDLKKLEEGVQVDIPFPRTVKAACVVHCGDNLEQHNLGGYTGSFSSRDICRFCHIQHSDLENCIHDFTAHGPHRYWTVTEYNEIISKLPGAEEDETPVELVTDENLFTEVEEPGQEQQIFVVDYDGNREEDDMDDTEMEDIEHDKHGLRYECAFNELSSFHAVYSLPPDFMHDLLEGAVAEDLMTIIKILILKKYFHEGQYNNALKSFDYKSGDRPEEISVKNNKIKGKALSILCHLRHFGFIVEKLNPSSELLSESVLQLYSALDGIVNVMMAPKIQRFELATFSEHVIDYLDKRKVIFAEFPTIEQKPKPKHHNLSHYAESIEKYGPSLGFWTARFESKHRVSKNLTHSSKNFVNITKTLSERQQLRQCSVFYRGLYETEDITIKENVRHKFELVVGQCSTLESKIVEFMDAESLLMNEIRFKGQDYCNGDVIILGAMTADDLVVGLIQGIIYKNRSVYFVVHKYEAFRHEQLRFFTTLEFDDKLHLVQAESLKDYKPLVKHGSIKRFRFVTAHHVTVDV